MSKKVECSQGFFCFLCLKMQLSSSKTGIIELILHLKRVRANQDIKYIPFQRLLGLISASNAVDGCGVIWAASQDELIYMGNNNNPNG